MKRDLGRLVEREHDLLVVGGGIYGVASAWDAAQRGLAVALVEAEDFGSRTSWNSLKTIHGGLRHLQRVELGLMRESIRERRAFLRIAPQLVRPLPFLVPTYGHGLRGREAFVLALRLYDLIARNRNDGLSPEQHIPRGRLLSPEEVRALAPGIPQAGLSGGALWTDAQVTTSERLLLGFLHAACSAGAQMANRVAVRGFLRRGSRVTGVQAWDAEGQTEIMIRARTVLNAAGPGLDDLLALAGVARPKAPLLRAMNLVLNRPLVSTHALGARSGGRYVFLVPWRDRAIVGTAYEPAETDGGVASVRSFLEAAARAYPWAGLSQQDVCLVHRGLVPGRHDGGGLFRRPLLLDHEAEDGVPGLISVLGVKYTTARSMAEKAVDLACLRLGRAFAPCRTEETPLPRASPLAGSLEEQTRHAVREEMALHLSDAILRRLDLGTAGAPAPADVLNVARTMALELSWNEARVAEERQALARDCAAAHASYGREPARMSPGTAGHGHGEA